MSAINLREILFDFAGVTNYIATYGSQYDAKTDTYQIEPFQGDTRAGKNSAVYQTHPYHTKVPPEGIKAFIKHYTEEGDLVLDPFCGSGMTGLAALELNRRPILLDLSPAATFITTNYCCTTDTSELKEWTKRILAEIKDEMDWLYETACNGCGRKASLDYVIWSDKLICPRCSAEFLLWDVAVLPDGRMENEFSCPNCDLQLDKTKCVKTGSSPVKVAYTCPKCKRQEDDASTLDEAKIEDISRRWQQVYAQKSVPDSPNGFWPIGSAGELWFPSDLMMHNGKRWGDLWRAGTHKGITRVCHFYTERNLWALARIWERIAAAKTDIQPILEFCFTAAVPSCTRMYRYRLGGGGRGSGTLYLPSLSEERNAVNAFSKKASVIAKSLSRQSYSRAAICTQSATDLSNIPADSVDYIFTDPPFGGNLMYSELNFIWEAWLRLFTDQEDEAIISETQKKGLPEYRNLMSRSLAEMHRVLKPGRWMTMVFHNSRGDVWQVIQEGLNAAGFAIAAIGILDKRQKTWKQITTTGAVGYDVILNCHKPKVATRNGINGKVTDSAIKTFIVDKLSEAPLQPSEDRQDRKLHSQAIAFFVQRGVALEDLDFKKFRTLLSKNFKEIDDHWFLSYQRPELIGQKNLFGFISTESQAIAWLDDFLTQGPKTIGDITPHFFVALGSRQLKKELKQILEENFVEENRRWRNPSHDEQQRLKKLAASATLVEIRQYLAGTLEEEIASNTLCEWIGFCYENELYEEGAKLFEYVQEVDVEASIYVVTKKIAEICRSRL